MATVLEKMGNPFWNVIIVGDGSGSGWAHAAGWASTLIANLPEQPRRFFYGACNCGSVNLAETMPYLQSLTWYDIHYGKEQLKTTGILHVHILTDSQTITTWGNRSMSPGGDPPRKMLAFWAAMRELRRVGYQCTFHWAPRMTTQLNWAADLMAGLSRQEIMKSLDPTYVTGSDPSVRAANAIDNLVFYNPDTGKPINPYELNRNVEAATTINQSR